ncbi:hypothetical protein ACSQ76_07155 [Roseovarius sp. B08]|uniref:hypothetical protein n=1 Tax=Roseovarius sp. B08 TaxID=3449223 RepID=UPI003EDBBE9D
MIDWFLIGLVVALGGGAEDTSRDGAARAGAGGAQALAGFEAEDQTPTGKFTTAAEIKPIIEATRGNWVAVREYDGQDLLYLTHLLSWRCGMHQVRVGVNGGAMEVWQMPPCQTDTAAPNAFPDDAVIYKSFGPGEIESIAVEILYDDLATAEGTFGRTEVLIP